MTTNPTAEWIARQITEAFPWDEAPRYLLRDRDTSYGAAVTRRLRTMGIRDQPITPRSPWQNGHVERLIGSIRRECLDHVVVFGEGHLRHLLAKYCAYYNGARTHLALDKDSPLHRPLQQWAYRISPVARRSSSSVRSDRIIGRYRIYSWSEGLGQAVPRDGACRPPGLPPLWVEGGCRMFSPTCDAGGVTPWP